MFNSESDLIFPARVIPTLSAERGPVWADLVDSAQKAGSDSPQRMAFILMMARLCNCVSCNSDSYRAIHGCASCAQQAIKRIHAKDEELVHLYNLAHVDVETYQNDLAGENQISSGGKV